MSWPKAGGGFNSEALERASKLEDERRGVLALSLDAALLLVRAGKPVPIAGQLTLATEKLRALARECAECAGSGELPTDYVAYVLTDSPRLIGRARAAGKRSGPNVRNVPVGCGVLRARCHVCADIRQVLEICGVVV